MLWRVHENDVIVEALAGEPQSRRLHTHVGAVIPLDRTIIGKVVAGGGGTRAWDDILESDVASSFALAHETRALIVTTFGAGIRRGVCHLHRSTRPPCRSVRAITFISTSWRRFSPTTCNSAGSSNASSISSRTTCSRACSTARSSGRPWRSAARTSSRYAIILVDVDAFREINDRTVT